MFLRSVADGLAPHEETPAGAYCESIICLFFHIFFFVGEKGKTLFMFIAILICFIYTEVFQSLKNSAYTSLGFGINSVA
jgi:hypothetical protein